MNRTTFAIAVSVALALPVAGRTAPTPGSPSNPSNNQVATNVVALPNLPTTSGSGSSPANSGTPASTGRVQVLCLAASASVTQPFFTGTDLTCAP
jgi:hypothetical protein